MVALISLCLLCVLCVSVVHFARESVTTEAQRTQRMHREEGLRKCIEDFKLLGSVYVARFIVWRALRRERKEKQ